MARRVMRRSRRRAGRRRGRGIKSDVTMTPLYRRHSTFGRRSAGRSGSATAPSVRQLVRERVKRKISFTGRFSKQRRVNDESGNGFAGGQYDKYKFRFGKKKRVTSLMRKIDSRMQHATVLRYGATNRFTDEVAAYQLPFYTSNEFTWTRLPVNILELTQKNFDDTINYSGWAYAKHQLHFDEAENKGVKFMPLFLRPNSGVGQAAGYSILKNQSAWPVDESQFGRDTNAAVLEWVNAKFLFKCPRTRPGWVRVQLVQITEPDLQPTAVPNEPRDAFWQRYVKECLYNPISSEVTALGRGYHRGFKVLKTWTKNFSPDTSSNLATYAGQQIRMDLFVRLNRFCNFNKKQGEDHTTLAQLDDDAYVTELGKDIENPDDGDAMPVWRNSPPDPRSRVFFVISGTHFDGPGAGFDDPSVSISYDMEVRNKWVWRADT